jgi:hypothetical protein
MIRPLRPVDIVALSRLQARAALVEVTSHTWPKVQPESGHFPHVALLSQMLVRSIDRRCAWVSCEGRRVTGLILGRSRAGGLVWDVEHLYALEDRDAAALLDALSVRAGERGARRVFMETPAGERGIEISRRTGFTRYARAELFYLPAHAPRSATERFSARPRLRVDDQPLFQLYMAAVPPRVRTAEAMTYEEWAALHRGRRTWSPTLFGERQQLVWELGAWLSGWAELIFGARSQFLEMIVHPESDRNTDQMLAYALSQLSEKAPVYATARDYQPSLASSLQRAGFGTVADQDMFVKQLAVHAPRPVLAPAQVVRA